MNAEVKVKETGNNVRIKEEMMMSKQRLQTTCEDKD